jgi:hypothetical protein|tara:strand:- start:337 stop:657 length:321 start_codon:yes stop_codon:yes gene_type:complete
MTLTEHDFINLTNKFSQHKDNFSYEGKKALFEYLQEYEQSTDEQIEFDYIALCVDYSEYDNLDDLFEAYDLSLLMIKNKTEVIEFYKYDLENFKTNDYKSYIIRNF